MVGSNHLRRAILVAVLSALVYSVAPAQKLIESRNRTEEFVGWVQPDKLYWRPFLISGVADAEFKLLSFDDTTKARSQITKFPAGWSQASGYYQTNEEIFVLSGEMTVGDVKMTKYSYAYFPAGNARGPRHSSTGATVLHWWDGEPTFVASRESKPDARRDELVEDWNFYRKPWTKNADFPKWSDFPPSPEMRLKLLRKDKVTGQMTWINMGAAGGGGGSRGGRVWEAHPSWEEAMLLEGDLTYGECLPGKGEIVGTYTAGGYFFRPARIRHGGQSSSSSSYSLFIFRSGTPIWADYFDSCDNSAPAKATGGAQ
ncbi:hypothetical protein BH18ACI4_BH18ACI4_01670 [soil metagenome]